MNTDLNQIREKIKNLESERDSIREKLSHVEELTSRLRQLVPGWGSLGEIEITKRELRDAQFPILSGVDYWITRIIAVDKKWIVTRDDRADDNNIKRYHRDTGRLEHTRTDYRNIDVKKALEIWERHNNRATTNDP